MRDPNPNWKRRLARNVPGQAHELTFSTFKKLPVLTLPGIAETFLQCLNEARQKADFLLHAYVVMPDHCHLVIYPNKEDHSIASILSAIKTPAATAILELRPELRETMRVYRPSRGYEARFWQQGGGFDRNIPTVRARKAMITYIHGNPVRAGLCTEAAEWPWSSYPEYAGGKPPIPVDPTDWW